MSDVNWEGTQVQTMAYHKTCASAWNDFFFGLGTRACKTWNKFPKSNQPGFYIRQNFWRNFSSFLNSFGLERTWISHFFISFFSFNFFGRYVVCQRVFLFTSCFPCIICPCLATSVFVSNSVSVFFTYNISLRLRMSLLLTFLFFFSPWLLFLFSLLPYNLAVNLWLY